MCLSGGNEWSKDPDKILDHARELHYDHVPGVNLPSADAPRQEWIGAMDAFNAWKAREVAKQTDGQAWWQTYQSDSGGGGGDNGGGGGDNGGGGGGNGGGGGPDWDNPDPGTGTGPYPDSNMYFPMLVPEYEAPAAQDWGRYMPRGQQGANVRPGDIWSGAPDLSGGGGLLYQPWTSTYADRFVPDSLWDYNPPELKVGRPQFYQNPLGNLEVVHPEPETQPTTNPDPSQTDGNPDSTYGNPNLGTVAGYVTGADGKTYGVDINGMVIGSSGYPSVDLTTRHNPDLSLGTAISGFFSPSTTTGVHSINTNMPGFDLDMNTTIGGSEPSVSNDLGDTYGDPMV